MSLDGRKMLAVETTDLPIDLAARSVTLHLPEVAQFQFPANPATPPGNWSSFMNALASQFRSFSSTIAVEGAEIEEEQT
jgi:hypothetical protein